MTKRRPIARRLALLAALGALAGCQLALPMPGGPATGPGAGTALTGPDAGPGEARAVAACTDGARARGLDVRGVAAVTPNAEGREVMLDIVRGSAAGTLRCLYVAATDEARIMLL